MLQMTLMSLRAWFVIFPAACCVLMHRKGGQRGPPLATGSLWTATTRMARKGIQLKLQDSGQDRIMACWAPGCPPSLGLSCLQGTEICWRMPRLHSTSTSSSSLTSTSTWWSTSPSCMGSRRALASPWSWSTATPTGRYLSSNPV